MVRGGVWVEGADELVAPPGALFAGGALVVANGVLDGGADVDADGVAFPVAAPDVVVESGGAGSTTDLGLGVVAPVVRRGPARAGEGRRSGGAGRRAWDSAAASGGGTAGQQDGSAHEADRGAQDG